MIMISSSHNHLLNLNSAPDIILGVKDTGVNKTDKTPRQSELALCRHGGAVWLTLNKGSDSFLSLTTETRATSPFESHPRLPDPHPLKEKPHTRMALLGPSHHPSTINTTGGRAGPGLPTYPPTEPLPPSLWPKAFPKPAPKPSRNLPEGQGCLAVLPAASHQRSPSHTSLSKQNPALPSWQQ